MNTVNYQMGALTDGHAPTVQAFLDESPRYPTIMLRRIARDFTGFDGWWRGAMGGGALRAVAAVSNHHVANIYGDPTEAVSALAQGMYRAAAGRASTGGTHRLFGETSVLATFWDMFRSINRTKVDDRERELMSVLEVPEVKKAYEVRRATVNDLALVTEFGAEQQVEQGGVDPRRGNRDGWENRCKQELALGNTLIGYQRGKPAFLAVIDIHEERVAMLDRVYVPRPMRRPRVVAGVMGAAAKIALEDNDEVLVFVDADKEEAVEGCTAAGFEARCRYRLITLR